MELPHWLDEFAIREVRDKFRNRFSNPSHFKRDIEAQNDSAHRAKDSEEVMLRKNHAAIGAFNKSDRTVALDLIGVASQLVFPTSANVWLEQIETNHRALDLDLLYGTASATNRSQVEFCSSDSRLLPVGYIPIADRERAISAAEEAIGLGVKALLVPWACPRDHAISHIELDRVWTQAEEAGIPVLFHVGVADKVLPSAHQNNGLPKVPDFHGGQENFRSISYMAIPHGPMQALSILIFDGVFDRFEELKVGVIELGASWIPGFMRQLDSALEAFGRHEQRLQNLKLKPSEYMVRQVRVTPYPTEPTRWIIDQSSPNICMFSTDYPHTEGGRNPYGRFSRSLADASETIKDRFFRGNFEDLMGEQIAADVNYSA